MSTDQKNKGKIIAIIAMMFLFAMIAFVTNLAAPFGLIWGNQYSWAGMMGNMMNFLAYLFMGVPAGTMLVKIGYKKTALTAMAVGFVGLFIQYLSSIIGCRYGALLGRWTRGVSEPDYLSVGCLHLRFLRVHAQHGGKPHAEPARWRWQQG